NETGANQNSSRESFDETWRIYPSARSVLRRSSGTWIGLPLTLHQYCRTGFPIFASAAASARAGRRRVFQKQWAKQRVVAHFAKLRQFRRSQAPQHRATKCWYKCSTEENTAEVLCNLSDAKIEAASRAVLPLAKLQSPSKITPIGFDH